MPVQRLKASTLALKHQGGFCFGCWQKPTDVSGEALWTIWTATMFYCPTCAKQEGIGPEQF